MPTINQTRMETISSMMMKKMRMMGIKKITMMKSETIKTMIKTMIAKKMEQNKILINKTKTMICTKTSNK